MPPAYVKTIREEILYEYAKLISRAAYGSHHWGFITNQFVKLRDGEISISGTIREWEREQQSPRQCVYCGREDDLSTDHIIPRSRGGADTADNLVLACSTCNGSRNNRGIFEWLGQTRKDHLHRLVAGKYLKELLRLHEEAGTLEVRGDEIERLCRRCSLPAVCARDGTEQKLTCYCLESVLPPPSP